MTSLPPPQGMNEVDYEAIEAAVTETVRGRWFLAEFARRNRLAETRQLLDAMSRIEAAVAGGQFSNNQTALPPADPSIRLLVQRIKEVASQLDTMAGDMREAGIDAHFVTAVDLQARAVAGMMRGATPVARDALPAKEVERPASVPAPPVIPRMPPAALATPPSGAPLEDPRLAVLSGLDGLTLAEKLALFA